MPVMLRHPMRCVAMLPHLRRALPMMRHRLHRLVVIGLGPIADRELRITKVIAHPIPRENLRGHQPRADVSAVIAQDKLVKTGFLSRPVFARWNQDGSPRRSSRTAENKGMAALATEHLHIRHLPRIFLHDDGGERASGESYDQKRTDKEFRAHNNEVERTPAL